LKYLRYLRHLKHLRRVHRTVRAVTFGWAGIELFDKLHWINLEELAHSVKFIAPLEWIVNLLHLVH
jgi:hypothetical protein